MNAHWFLTLADAAEKLEAWRWILQREPATWRDRQQDLDHADEIWGHHQPVSL